MKDIASQTDKKIKSQVTGKIDKLKKEKNAIILAHFYQQPEVQDIADFTGDSLDLSRKAAAATADVIVFCGVRFMAETAAILSPRKKVIMPAPEAGCPMADMVTAEELRALKTKHPRAVVVCYVNTTAEVKAESDICCTSANAVKVVKSIPADKEIIFVPDRCLGDYAARKSGRKFINWQGYCSSHIDISEADMKARRHEHPEAKVMAHPECRSEVIQLADKVASTSGMLKYAAQEEAAEFIVATEIGMLYPLRKQNPDKKFFAASNKAFCYNMKLINLNSVLYSLENTQYEIRVPDGIRDKAASSIERMLEIS